MLSITYFTLSFALTLWLSKFLLRFIEPTYFLDHPNQRKIHDTPTPHFGGIAFSITYAGTGSLTATIDGSNVFITTGATSTYVSAQYVVFTSI